MPNDTIIQINNMDAESTDRSKAHSDPSQTLSESAAEISEDTPVKNAVSTGDRKPKGKHEYRGQMLNRWPRAFARLFDLLWEIPLALLALVLIASATGSNSQNLGTIEIAFFLVLSLPLALLIDGLIAGIFSNTPAKAMIGVKATTSRGERLHLVTHLRRNFGVWTDGLALGIVPLSIINMFRQFKRVSGRREAIYDERLHVRVRSGRRTGFRVLIPLFLLVAGFATLLAYLADTQTF